MDQSQLINFISYEIVWINKTNKCPITILSKKKKSVLLPTIKKNKCPITIAKIKNKCPITHLFYAH